MKNIQIDNKVVGPGNPVYFIADIAANHDGDLERAKELIHLAAECGADAAKFQNFKAHKIVSDLGFKQLGNQLSHQADWRESVYETYEKASLSDSWTSVLKKECDKAGIAYSTSPYDFASVDQAAPFVSFFKIGSGDITWPEICRYIASKKKPVFLACGASSLEDVDRAMNALSDVSELVLMQCNTNYTASKENFSCVNLKVLTLFAQRYTGVITGLSDHTPGYSAVLGAVALGAQVIEKHFTDDTSRKGPDHAFSLTPQTWSEMVEHTRELEAALGDGIKRVEKNEQETVVLQRRCLRAVRDLLPGHIIRKEDFEPLRPAPKSGVEPWQQNEVAGTILKIGLQMGEHLTWQHLEKGQNP